jgi:hypothetical protein
VHYSDIINLGGLSTRANAHIAGHGSHTSPAAGIA